MHSFLSPSIHMVIFSPGRSDDVIMYFEAETTPVSHVTSSLPQALTVTSDIFWYLASMHFIEEKSSTDETKRLSGCTHILSSDSRENSDDIPPITDWKTKALPCLLMVKEFPEPPSSFSIS